MNTFPGLDQDMMQKNLTCKSLREAQKDVCSYGFAFVPANLLFLSLGVLLMIWRLTSKKMEWTKNKKSSTIN